MKTWVVSIKKEIMNDGLAECLRYAGVVRVSGFLIHILPPKGVSNQKQWAESNAERMATFGLKATATAI